MRRFHRPPNRPSFVVGICLALIGGVAAAPWMRLDLITLMVVAVWAVLVWRSAVWWLGLMVLAGACGVVRAEDYSSRLMVLTSQIGQMATIEGTVVTDPVTDATFRTSFQVGQLRVNGRSVPSKIRVSGRSLRVLRGFSVRCYGRLRPGFATWDAALSYPKLTVLSDHLSLLETLRQRFFTGMRAAVPDPEAAFGLGLLVGVGALIPKPLQVQLTRVGLSHLTAVSGYNLTIIVRLITRLLGRLGPNVAMVLSLWLIASFVVIAGGSASIVRAGAIASLSLVAGRAGFRVSPSVLIAVTAAATLFYNPAYLKDVGWALSFLAFFGILVLAPAIMMRTGEPKWALGRMVIETLAAEVMTLPYIMVTFHQLSLVGLIANIVIEPIVPLAMAVSAAAAVAGMLMVSILVPLGAVATGVLEVMLVLIASLAAIPWAQAEIAITPLEASLIYGLIFLSVWLVVHRSARKARFAILARDRSKTDVRTLKMAFNQTPEGD